MLQFSIVDKRRTLVRLCSDAEVAALLKGPGTPEYKALLRSLIAARHDVKCPSDIVRRPVRHSDPYLQRYGGQAATGTCCCVCARTRTRPNPGTKSRRCCVIGPILRSPATGQVDPDSRDRKGGDAGVRYPRHLGVLRNLLHAAEAWIVDDPKRPTNEGTFFDALADVLAQHSVSSRVSLKTQTSRAYFTWMPGRHMRGGRCELLRRLVEDWPDPARRREGWMVGIVTKLIRRQDRYEVHIKSLLTPVAEKLRAGGVAVKDTFRYEIPADRLVAPVRKGPFVGLFVFSVAGDGTLQGARLELEWVLLQAVASLDLLVPVDSDLERRFVALLKERGEPFRKPIVADEDGLRPDFILPRLGVVLELDGMLQFEKYVRQKGRSHIRLEDSPKYAHLCPVVYDVKSDDDLDDLLRLLYGEQGEGHSQNVDNPPAPPRDREDD